MPEQGPRTKKRSRRLGVKLRSKVRATKATKERKANPRTSKRSSSRKPAVPADPKDAKLYSQFAGVYDFFFDRVFRTGRKLAVELLDISEGDRILEVGVGTGLSFRYYPANVHVTGIDLSPQMLREAEGRREKLGRTDIELHQMDVMNLDFPDGTFDKILASHVLSAVPDPHGAFREIKRVCAPGGTIAISNRFHSDKPMIRAAEKAMNPLTRKIGFIMDLPMELLTDDPELEVERIHKFNVPALWRVVSLVKRGTDGSAPPL